MPSTYNGIGTHYYGKKNIQKRGATCRQCGRQGELTSYDTRLWFVIVFIPIVPLGRKRIIDYCGGCTRHYVVEADKWETSKQLEISGAREKFRVSQSLEDAMPLHQQMMNFHQLDQAAEFRKTMCEKFADNAKVHAYLGASLEQFGKLDESAVMFQRALDLRSDMPEARTGVAQTHLRAGKLDEARKLLDFLEKPGAAQLYEIEPLNKLAQAYQRAERHAEALELFAVIQREVPVVAEKKWFRKFVAKSEKAVKRTESQLPKQKFSFKRLFQVDTAGASSSAPHVTWKSLLVLGVIVALVLLGFVIANEYTRRHRTLHIVNAFGQPATVRIAGVDEIKNIRGTREVTLVEGHYHASISGPVADEVDFDIRSSYFDRWGSDPAWVLNVGGKAVLIRTEATYSAEQIPAHISVHFGNKFETFGDISHPFRDLPQSLQVSEHGSRTLVSLNVHQGNGVDIAAYYLTKGDVNVAMNFSETWLKMNPEDEQMLRLYAAQALRQHQTNRLDVFLRPGLKVRPLRTEWHRTYQQTHDNPATHDALVTEYQDLLRGEPTNSALLYLCGRLEADRAQARDYFERSQRADSSNAYPAFAIGYDYMNTADWPQAWKFMSRAVELRKGDVGFEHWLLIARLGAGEVEAIEQETREQIKRNPADIAANHRLVDVLARQNKREDALASCKSFAAVCNSSYGRRGMTIAQAHRCLALYELGDFAELEKLAAASSELAAFRFQALIELGRVTNALKFLPRQPDDDVEKPLLDLAISLAFRRAGDAAQADHWAEQARLLLADGNEDEAAAAGLLARNPATLTMTDLKNFVLPPQLKAAVLAHLAQQNSPARAELAALARRLNVERTFPYHVIQRSTEPRP